MARRTAAGGRLSAAFQRVSVVLKNLGQTEITQPYNLRFRQQNVGRLQQKSHKTTTQHSFLGLRINQPKGQHPNLNVAVHNVLAVEVLQCHRRLLGNSHSVLGGKNGQAAIAMFKTGCAQLHNEKQRRVWCGSVSFGPRLWAKLKIDTKSTQPQSSETVKDS